MSEVIKVEIDPAVKLPNRRVGTDEDGYPRYGEVTLHEAIVDAAATQLVDGARRGLAKAVAFQVEESVKRMLDAELPAIFERALNEPVAVSDEWGGKTKSKPLRDLIAEHAQKEMKVGSDHGRGTVMDMVVREEIESSLHKTLAEEVAAAKAQIRKRLAAKVAELLATGTL